MARADHSSHTSERGARCCPQDARQQAAAAAAPSAAVASHCGGTQVEGVVVLTGGSAQALQRPNAGAGQQCLLAFPPPSPPSHRPSCPLVALESACAAALLARLDCGQAQSCPLRVLSSSRFSLPGSHFGTLLCCPVVEGGLRQPCQHGGSSKRHGATSCARQPFLEAARLGRQWAAGGRTQGCSRGPQGHHRDSGRHRRRRHRHRRAWPSAAAIHGPAARLLKRPSCATHPRGAGARVPTQSSCRLLCCRR